MDEEWSLFEGEHTVPMGPRNSSRHFKALKKKFIMHVVRFGNFLMSDVRARWNAETITLSYLMAGTPLFPANRH